MDKTFRVIESYPCDKRIKVYENGKIILSITPNDYDFEVICQLLEALGYQMMHRKY